MNDSERWDPVLCFGIAMYVSLWMWAGIIELVRSALG